MTVVLFTNLDENYTDIYITNLNPNELPQAIKEDEIPSAFQFICRVTGEGDYTIECTENRIEYTYDPATKTYTC